MTDKNLQLDHRPVTVSHILGEITWLLSQSINHRDLKVSELNWLVMPPILHKQFHLFREGEKPVGVVLWAMTSEDGERKITEGKFRSGQAIDADWSSGNRRWLVELITPFATIENRQAELMFADLLTGVFSGQSFKMMKIDPATGVSAPTTIASDTGERLVEHLQQTGLGR